LAGRTETVRSVSHESVKFAETWLDANSSREEKMSTLKAATKAHHERMSLCKEGQGVDRHLYGMLNIARWKLQSMPSLAFNFPALFKDPAFSKLTTSVLSTSNVSAPCFDLFGFGPVCSQGLGIAYNVQEDSLRINITSFQGEAKKYAEALTTSLREMHEVCSKQ